MDKQDWISEKIRKLREEGKEQDEAVAIAHSMWEREHKSMDDCEGDDCPDENMPDEMSDDEEMKALIVGGEVKSTADGYGVEGYLVLFGSSEEADFDGDYFTPETDFGLDWNAENKATVYFHHGLDPVIGDTPLCGGFNKATLTLKERGVWIEARLKEGDIYDEMVRELMQKRAARGRAVGWSSGSARHLVKKVPRGGANWIAKWRGLGIDASITHAPNDWRNTAELKSITDLLKEDAVADTQPEAASATGDGSGVHEHMQAADESREETTMSEDQIKALAAQIVSEVAEGLKTALSDNEAAEVEAKTVAALQESIEAAPAGEAPDAVTLVTPEIAKTVAGLVNEVKALRKSAVSSAIKAHMANRQPQSQVNGVQRDETKRVPSVQVFTKYHDLSAEDMSYYYCVKNLRARNQGFNQGWRGDEAFYRELADKTLKSVEKHELKVDADTLKTVGMIKSNELDHSTNSSAGDEWVPDLWATNLWERMRLDNVISPLFPVIEMPSNPFNLPLESTDPTVYAVSETTGEEELLLDGAGNPIPDSKLATNNTSITAYKMGLRVGFSTELEEDSIIPFVAQLRKQSLRAMMDAIDHVILNADASSSLNINLYGGSPAASTKYRLGFDGLRHLPLVDNTANATSAGGANPTLAKIRQARFLLAPAYAARPGDLAIITHTEVYAKLLGLDEYSTMDKIGASATAMTGQLGMIDGMPLFVTNELGLTDTSGYINNTAASNLYGSLVIVHRPSIYIGYRRRVNVSVTFLPYYDSSQLVATVRIGMVKRDTDCVSELYYIGV